MNIVLRWILTGGPTHTSLQHKKLFLKRSVSYCNFTHHNACFWHCSYTSDSYSPGPYLSRLAGGLLHASKKYQNFYSRGVWLTALSLSSDTNKHTGRSRLRAVRGSFSGKAHSWMKPQSSHIMHIERKSRSNGPWKAPWVQFLSAVTPEIRMGVGQTCS